MLRDIDKGGIFQSSFRLDIHGKKRILIVIEAALIEFVEFLIRDIFLLFLPKRNHGIERFITRFIMIFSFNRLSILILVLDRMADEHANRVTDEV